MRFLVINGRDEERVVEDICKLLLIWPPINSTLPFKKENGSWILDAGNDLFLLPLTANSYDLYYRYGREDTLAALGAVLEWRGPYKVIK